MRYCTNCGHESSSRICLNCGVKNHKVPNFCYWCGAPLNKKAAICVACRESTNIGTPIGFKIVDILLICLCLFSVLTTFSISGYFFVGIRIFCIIVLLPFVGRAIVRVTHKARLKGLLRAVLFSFRILFVFVLFLVSFLAPVFFVFDDPLIGEWQATAVSIDGKEYFVEEMYGESEFTLTVKHNHSAILIHPEEAASITYSWYQQPEYAIGTEYEGYPFHPDGDYEYMTAKLLSEDIIAFWSWNSPDTIYYFENVK